MTESIENATENELELRERLDFLQSKMDTIVEQIIPVATNHTMLELELKRLKRILLETERAMKHVVKKLRALDAN